MAFLSKYYHLALNLFHLFVARLYLLLKSQHDGTGRIDEMDILLFCRLIGLGRFAMSPDEDFGIVKLTELIVINYRKPLLGQTPNFSIIVDNISKTIEPLIMRELLFGCRYGLHNAETKAGFSINGYHVQKSVLEKGM